MTKPVLYLDVDGVINFFSGTEFATQKSASVFLPPHDRDYIIQWSPTLIHELNNLPVEIVWLTTWRQWAVDLLTPLFGLNAPTFLPWSEKFSDYTQGFKWVAIQEDQEKNPRPFIWVDDIATENYFYDERDGEIPENLSPHLVIQPYSYYGLTPAHVQQMKEFLASLPA